MIRFTKYEKARIIGTRANQLADGAKPRVDFTGLTTALAIAEKEFEEKQIPLIVVRKFPNGKIEEISVMNNEE